jgi:hypothetical protein
MGRYTHETLTVLLCLVCGTAAQAQDVSLDCPADSAEGAALGDHGGFAARRSSGSALRVSERNPRYFADASGRAVLLAGAHTWNNLVDMGPRYPPRAFDYEAYLDFLEAHHHNLIRLWAWEVAQPEDGRDTPLRAIVQQHPWLRTGPGTDVSGLPRFDLDRPNSEYFARLRARVSAARERGMYVSVMLFEGWSVQSSPGKLSHPFYPGNNINDTDFLSDVRDVHTLRHPAITKIQEAYVTRVLDALEGLDNVLLEIANEAGDYSTEWQYHMLRFTRCQMASRGNVYPIGMTYQYRGGRNATLFESAADWVSPGAESGNYLTRPAVADGSKVIIADTDHLEGSSLAEVSWIYRSLLSGFNLLYMDRYYGRDALNPQQQRFAPEARAAVGHARLIAEHVDIGTSAPDPDLSTTGYALRGPHWLLVLSTSGERFAVDLRSLPGELRLEWFDPATALVADGGSVAGGQPHMLSPPSPRPMLLYVRQAESPAPRLAHIDARAREIRSASLRYAQWDAWLRIMAGPYLDRVRDGYRVLVASLLGAASIGLIFGLAGGYWLSRRMRAHRGTC